jgi:hypothetical protein
MMFSIAPAQAQDTDSIPWYGRLASLFATAGYTSTRYASDGKLYKNKPLFELGVALF